MTAIGKGDFVEAVRTVGHITAGSLYVVEEITPHDPITFKPCICCGQTSDDIYLRGVSNWFAYCPCDLRPVSGGETGMFADLLKLPTDAPLAPAAA